MNNQEQPTWRRSSQCANGTCVEVARVDDGYLIRDSKNPSQEPLSFTEDELTVFAAAFASGEFRNE
ncbi:DUF397 domain-containing protein [Actinoplanes sp. ATCC 53533]|uniref:DUF397 domain-containing protein n=1 Tax=Actinoplanes sp. ATCC 53533 TaxID=1288362 RepID=UPI000F77A214|nr:DUF397 domain-containing protein [Actinoplanes sp. ATCC 53533]RSM68449.1 DUF397 domain-containing protein [Actinoplanes sp. ATCC 53533]